MKILGIETSTLMVGVAILDKTGLVAEYRFEATRSRSERLMPMIDRVLKDSQMTPQDLEGLAISLGPGSFTGLRVGLSTAKGLAFSLGLPVVGVPTLEVLAAPLAAGRCRYPICPMLDAKRQEVYAALFSADAEGGLRRIMEDEAISPIRLGDQLAERREPILFLGTGALLYEDEIKKRLGDFAIFVSRLDPYPSPSTVATLGMKRLMSGGGDDLSSLTPLYLSRFQAKTSL
jgi:tRNA threonylcarbamoyladenosine biosynthesis protein TsaB